MKRIRKVLTIAEDEIPFPGACIRPMAKKFFYPVSKNIRILVEGIVWRLILGTEKGFLNTKIEKYEF